MDNFYDRVKQLSRKRKISLQELIISSGMNLDTYYSMKRTGNLPRADEALTIAQALGSTVEYLVSGKQLSSAESALNEIQAVMNRYKGKL